VILCCTASYECNAIPSSEKRTCCNTRLYVTVARVDTAFQQLLKDILAVEFPGKGGQKRLARAMHLSASRISRAVNEADYTFSVLNCLQLAKAARRSPLVVLRAAGKEPIATLLEFFWGTSELTPGERAVLVQWNALGAKDHEVLEEIMARLATLRAQLPPSEIAAPPTAATPRASRPTAVAGRRRGR
jgi:hypothetical protein